MRFNTFYFVPVLGTTGRIIMACDCSQVIGTMIHKGSFSISIALKNISNNTNWVCSNVYGPNTRSLRFDFWNELHTVRNLHSDPWVIYGDFNTIFTLEDKNKGDFNSRHLAISQDFLGELNLIDPPI